MDSGETIPQEPISDRYSPSDGEILQIREFDLVKDIEKFLPIFWQSQLLICGEDKSETHRITIKDKEVECTEAEILIYWYLDHGSKIRIAEHKNEIVGFIIYNEVLETVVAIRMLYALPTLVGTKTGFRLVDSVPDIHTVIFQTVKEIPPEAMFSITRGREKKINETDKLITWAMYWEKEDGIKTTTTG